MLRRALAVRHLPSVLPPWARLWAKDSAMLLSSQGLTVAATSIAAILIARHLSPSDWGVFSGFLALSLSVAILVEFGLSTWLLRELSHMFAQPGEEVEAARRLVIAAVAVNGCVALVLTAAGTVVSAARGTDVPATVALAALLVYGGLFASSNVLEAHLRARRRVTRVAGASVLEKYVLLLLVLLATVAGAGIVGIGLAYVVAGMLRLVFLGVNVFAYRGFHLPLPSRRDMGKVVRHSFPFALTAGSLNLIPKLDTFVLLALSATSAGYFAVGDRVLGPALIVPATLGTALYPFMAARRRTGSPVWRLLAIFGLLGGALALVGILLASPLVPLLFGSKYEPAVSTVQVMLLALPLIFASTPLLVHGYSCHRERPILRATVGVSLVGTGAILLGQSLGGAPYAAAGAVLRQGLFVCALALIVRSLRGEGEEAAPAGERHEPTGSSRSSPSVEVVP